MVSGNYRSFEEARKFIHLLNLKNRKEWNAYCKSGKKPDDIPAYPNQVYKNKGWISLGDWLGTGTIHVKFRTYSEFEKARKFVRHLGLKSASEWKSYCRSGQRPNFIPTHPHKIYKNKGWISLGDWLGTDIVATRQRRYLEFNAARKFVQSLGLKSRREWKEFTKSTSFPKNIPIAPDQHYKNKGWISMGDWLGSGIIQPQLRKYWEFEKARKYVRGLGLQSSKDWRSYARSKAKPLELPASPDKSYKKIGWISMGDWLGSGVIAPQQKKFMSFNEARKVMHELAKKYNIRTAKDFQKAKKIGLIPENIPSAPWNVYSKKRKNEKTI